MGKKLFVGNLSFSTTSEELKEFFSKAGACESATVMTDRATGRSRGFGFVEMGSDAEAVRAISELNGTELQGRAVNVSEARERSERAGGFARRFGPPLGYPEGGSAGGQGEKRFPKEGGSRRGLRGRKRSL
jgi:RNA recognition motif-containing protein